MGLVYAKSGNKNVESVQARAFGGEHFPHLVPNNLTPKLTGSNMVVLPGRVGLPSVMGKSLPASSAAEAEAAELAAKLTARQRRAA